MQQRPCEKMDRAHLLPPIGPLFSRDVLGRCVRASRLAQLVAPCRIDRRINQPIQLLIRDLTHALRQNHRESKQLESHPSF